MENEMQVVDSMFSRSSENTTVNKRIQKRSLWPDEETCTKLGHGGNENHDRPRDFGTRRPDMKS